MNNTTSRDSLLNWLEDQDDHLIIKIAQCLNSYFLVPIWDEVEIESVEDIFYEIENSNSITMEIF